jgi:lysozyme
VGDSSKVLLALDIEENTNNITPQKAEDFVTQVLKITGRLPFICRSSNFVKDFATPTLTRCPLWIARWRRKLKLSTKRMERVDFMAIH